MATYDSKINRGEIFTLQTENSVDRWCETICYRRASDGLVSKTSRDNFKN